MGLFQKKGKKKERKENKLQNVGQPPNGSRENATNNVNAWETKTMQQRLHLAS